MHEFDATPSRDRGKTACPTARRRGASAHRWGVAAEELALKRYLGLGARLLARRARTQAGEIDLVLALGETMVFVEVKARRSLAEALCAASPRTWARRGEAAVSYAAAAGHTGDIRLDLAAVDRGGQIEIIENIGLEAAF